MTDAACPFLDDAPAKAIYERPIIAVRIHKNRLQLVRSDLPPINFLRQQGEFESDLHLAMRYWKGAADRGDKKAAANLAKFAKLYEESIN